MSCMQYHLVLGSKVVCDLTIEKGAENFKEGQSAYSEMIVKKLILPHHSLCQLWGKAHFLQCILYIS